MNKVVIFALISCCSLLLITLVVVGYLYTQTNTFGNHPELAPQTTTPAPQNTASSTSSNNNAGNPTPTSAAPQPTLNLPNGAPISCTQDAGTAMAGAIYRYNQSSNTRQWYPNPFIAQSWDPNWITVSTVDCSNVARGTDMTDNPATVFGGDNGTVNGFTYCQGVWGSPTGQNKNMTCQLGYDNVNNNVIDCNSTPSNNLKYVCR